MPAIGCPPIQLSNNGSANYYAFAAATAFNYGGTSDGTPPLYLAEV